MAENEKLPGVERDGDAEDRILSPESKDEEIRAERGESPPESTPLPHDPSDDSQVQGSPSPTEEAKGKVELDLEGLGKGKEEPPAAPIAASLQMSANGKRRRLAVAFLALITVLLGASWFGYRFVKTQRNEKTDAGVSGQGDASQKASQPIPTTDSYRSYGLAPFFVPVPMGKTHRQGFLKVTLILTFRGHVPSEEIEKKILIIRSQITDVLLRKTNADLHSREGKMALKREIRDLLNTSLTQGTVQRVYFKEFFIL